MVNREVGRRDRKKQTMWVNNGLGCEIKLDLPFDGLVWECTFIHYSLANVCLMPFRIRLLSWAPRTHAHKSKTCFSCWRVYDNVEDETRMHAQ